MTHDGIRRHRWNTAVYFNGYVEHPIYTNSSMKWLKNYIDASIKVYEIVAGRNHGYIYWNT